MRAMEIKIWKNKRSNEQNNSLALVLRTLFMLKLSLAKQQGIKFGMVCIQEH